MDASFSDSHSLLLHDFVNRDAVNVRHLVKLVDAHHPAVGEHHRACLEPALARLLVRRDRGGETDAGAAAAGRGDRERRGAEHEAEQLRLGRGRVADHEHVDVTADVRPVREVLLRAAEQEEEDGLLDELVPVDGRRERLGEQLEDPPLALRERVDRVFVWE